MGWQHVKIRMQFAQVVSRKSQLFFNHAKSPRGIAFEEPFLYREACIVPIFHTFACDRAVKDYWPGISNAMYNDIAIGYVCDRLTGFNCTGDVPGAQVIKPLTPTELGLSDFSDCDECIHYIAQLAANYENPDIMAGLIFYLGHEGYCENPVMALQPPQQVICRDWMREFMPWALRALNGGYASNARNICHYWYNGICDATD